MQMLSNRIKVVWIAILGSIAVLLTVIVVDALDFVSRWLYHFEPYKDNIERLIYFCVIVPLIYKCITKIKGLSVLKLNAGVFGFEICFGKHWENSDGENEKDEKHIGHSVSESTHYSMRGYEIANSILKKLGEELGLQFSENAVLKRGDCRYMPDGFAIKNGRAYVVEIKVGDTIRMIDNGVAQLLTFAQAGSDNKFKNVTLILCIVSRQSQSFVRQHVQSKLSDLNTEFVIRVFSPDELNKGLPPSPL